MSDLLNSLRKHRDLILLAEMGVMLHDIGKLSPGFIIQTGLDDRDRGPGPHSPNLHPDGVLSEDTAVVPPELYLPLANILSRPMDSVEAQVAAHSLSEFLTDHEGDPAPKPLLLALVTIADQRESGEDEHTAMGLRQRTAVHGATVFGYEGEAVDTSGFDAARHEVWQALTEALRGTGDWRARRDAFVTLLADKLSLTRGKTQRAANDITLYQHSRAVGTRFKAYLARDLVDTTRQRQKEFRLLNVAWDAWQFTVHIPRLSDAVGRRNLIETFKEAIRRLVELDYPLGNVVYHDDSTLVALVADLDVEAELRARIEGLARDITEGEIAPVVQLSPPTTQVTDIVTRRREARRGSPRGEIPPWATDWEDREGSVICPVCGHRPLRNSDDPHCNWCGQVRGRGVQRRLEEERGTVWTGEIADRNGRLALLVGRFTLNRWLNGELLHTALITSSRARAQARGWGDYPTCDLVEAVETCVQDPNTLLGMVTLDGSRADILRGQLDQARRRLENVRTNPGIPPDVRPQRIQAMEEQLHQIKAQVEPELASLQGALLVQGVFTQHRGETDAYLRTTAATLPADWPLVERYAAALARKNASAARLFRVWETTEEFFTQGVPEAVRAIFDEDRARSAQQQRHSHLWGRTQRLRFALSNVPRDLGAGIYTVAMVNREGQRQKAEVFLSREEGWPPAMITINRLSAEEKTWLERCTDAGHVEVLARETGRKEPRSELLGIQGVTREDYLPYHVLTTSPEMLVAILPAEIAPQVTQRIQAAYKRQMGKVMGRLPLYLGLFFMDKHFPMFVALDAARRAAEISDWQGYLTETWHVRQTPTVTTSAAGDQVYSLTVRQGRGPDARELPEYTWEVPFQLGNGEPDFYHPYFIVSESAAGFPLEERSTHLRTPTGYILHVSELQAEDQLCIYPNRFDFLLLDTVARRFDVRLDKETGRRPHPLFGPRHSPRPYLLEDLRRMEHVWEWCWPAGMTTTRLHGIRDLLAAHFAEWDLAEKERTAEEWQTYEELVAQVLRKEFSVYAPGSPAHKGLRQAMLDGLFFDCLELHLQILKEKGVWQ